MYGKICCPNCLDRAQVLAEMIILNESRVGGSRVSAAYSKPRAFEATLALRYQVPLRTIHDPDAIMSMAPEKILEGCDRSGEGIDHMMGRFGCNPK